MLKKPLFSVFGVLILATSALPSAVVRLDPVVGGQVFRGFGTCLVPWVGDMVRLYETQRFQEIYATELNFNLLRVDVMPYVHPEVTDPDDIRYQNFNIRSGGQQHADNARAGIFLDFAREIHAENPDTRVLLTVWSFPDWIKTNNSHLNGGAPKPTHYEHAAALLTEYVKQYEDEGVPVLGVSFANEPQFPQFYNSQVIDPAPYADILSVVGKRLEDAGKGHVMIYGPEHMTSDLGQNKSYVRAITAHEDAAGYLDAFASHGYLDGITSDPSSTAAARLWNEIARPNGWEFWMTEGGTGGHSYDASLDELAGMIHHHLAEANASVFTPWQVSGSERSEHNLMEMSTFTQKTRAMQHYSSVIEAGMTHIPTTSDGNVRTTAFGNRATGELGIVLLNVENSAEEVTLDVSYLDLANFDGVRTTRASAFEDLGTIPVSDGTATLTLPARSIVSLSAEDVSFEDIPVFTVNNGERLLQVPGYASELSIPVAIEDEAYPWSASLSSRRWAEIVAGE
ncbi:MAG: hypothetical protein GVY10_10705, partial [Verrucomicrobia bacterium]|nr:hypothetical protein [Verrucomicrobiota bacterium]